MGKEENEHEDIIDQILGRAEVNKSNAENGLRPHGSARARKLLDEADELEVLGASLKDIEAKQREAFKELDLDRRAERLIRQEKKAENN